jgi:hypothetical protein
MKWDANGGELLQKMNPDLKCYSKNPISYIPNNFDLLQGLSTSL